MSLTHWFLLQFASAAVIAGVRAVILTLGRCALCAARRAIKRDVKICFRAGGFTSQHLAKWKLASWRPVKHELAPLPTLVPMLAQGLLGWAVRAFSPKGQLLVTPAHGAASVLPVSSALCRSSKHFSGPAQDFSEISIHKSAVSRLKQLQQETPQQGTLRIEVEGGGCSGYQYKLKLVNGPEPDDRVFERDGVQVVCDAVSLEFLRGATVEFEDTLMSSAFRVTNNPNSESSCGCGSSFAAKV